MAVLFFKVECGDQPYERQQTQDAVRVNPSARPGGPVRPWYSWRHLDRESLAS
jgi:hypothetical protein